MKSIASMLLGALVPVTAFVVYELHRQAQPKRETSFETFDNTPLLHKGEDMCIWCGKAFPEPEFWNEHDSIWQEKIKPWVMQSYGNGNPPVMACEPLHMELWYMLPTSVRQ